MMGIFSEAARRQDGIRDSPSAEGSQTRATRRIEHRASTSQPMNRSSTLSALSIRQLSRTAYNVTMGNWVFLSTLAWPMRPPAGYPVVGSTALAVEGYCAWDCAG
jgi:hypothetical protein